MSTLTAIGRSTGFYAWLAWHNLRAGLRAKDMPLQIVATAVGQIGGLVALTALLRRATLLGGLSLATFLLVYGLVVFTEGICSVLFDGVWQLRFLINGRDLDFLMLRPRSVPLQLVFSRTGMHGAGNVLLGGTLIGYGLARTGTGPNPAMLAAAAMLVALGVVLRTALYLLGNATAFWSTAGVGLPMAVHQLTELGKFPLPVYRPAVRLLLTTVMPVSFIGFFPAMLALGERPWAGWAPAGLLAAAGFVLAAAMMFRAGLRAYRRT